MTLYNIFPHMTSPKVNRLPCVKLVELLFNEGQMLEVGPGYGCNDEKVCLFSVLKKDVCNISEPANICGS